MLLSSEGLLMLGSSLVHLTAGEPVAAVLQFAKSNLGVSWEEQLLVEWRNLVPNAGFPVKRLMRLSRVYVGLPRDTWDA